jgi:hypothetical protein
VQALINTSQHHGLQYHPRRAFLSPPKIKYQTVMVFERLPASRVLDDAWWLVRGDSARACLYGVSTCAGDDCDGDTTQQ